MNVTLLWYLSSEDFFRVFWLKWKSRKKNFLPFSFLAPKAFIFPLNFGKNMRPIKIAIKFNAIVIQHIFYFLLIWTDFLRFPSFGSPLFPPHKLCLDAMRRLLFAYSSCFCIYIWTKVSQMAHRFRMVNACDFSSSLWVFEVILLKICCEWFFNYFLIGAMLRMSRIEICK